jgi:3-hydroxyisobutyrate dehydrogenase-like beta-hydroxyacid dehydrogenase
MKVGFVGLGNMGSAMAHNLVKAGHEVIVYNRTPAKAEALAREGARAAKSLAEACQAEAVITMLADDAAVETVVFGAEGLLANLPAEAIHVSMSTISITLSERLAAAHQKAHQSYVAAPVFGRPEAAATAKLFIVAAGDQSAVDRCKPLFDAMGQRTFIVSEIPSAANLVKLSGNFLIASVIESLGEAVALTRKAGIDPKLYVDLLTSSLFAAPVYKTYGGLIANEQYRPAGFRASLGLKDIRLALAAAEARSVPMPIASLIRDHYLTLIAQGGEELDWSALGLLAARNAGLPPS